eukprot:5868019-Pleurochrysis_carterae.AAC.1
MSALGWFESFAEGTERVPFVDPASSGGVQYNQETLALLAEHIRRGGSRQVARQGSVLRAGTVSGYVSAIKLLRSREAG